jgi:hypothetical protein
MTYEELFLMINQKDEKIIAERERILKEVEDTMLVEWKQRGGSEVIEGTARVTEAEAQALTLFQFHDRLKARLFACVAVGYLWGVFRHNEFKHPEDVVRDLFKQLKIKEDGGKK